MTEELASGFHLLGLLVIAQLEKNQPAVQET